MFTRKQIENEILAHAQGIDVTAKNWLDSAAFAGMMAAWRDLAHYYDRHDDTTLAPHILKLYMRYAVKLRGIAADKRTTPAQRQQAKAALRDLNQRLDSAFRRCAKQTAKAV